MFDWLRKRLVRGSKPEAHAPDVQEAERVQKQQFDAWRETLKEVRRVEAVVAGRKSRSK